MILGFGTEDCRWELLVDDPQDLAFAEAVVDAVLAGRIGVGAVDGAPVRVIRFFRSTDVDERGPVLRVVVRTLIRGGVFDPRPAEQV